MKKLLLTYIAICFAMVGTTSTLSANAQKGQKIFKKNMRKACGFSGVRFSRSHTQEEWKEIYEANKLQQEAKKICPRLKLEKIKDSWWPNIYDFSYEYASDSARIPKC